MSYFLTDHWIAIFVLYVLAQLAIPMFLRWPLLLTGLLPLPFMLYFVWGAYSAYQQGSNMWPIMLVIFSPMALCYLLIVGILLVITRVLQRRARSER